MRELCHAAVDAAVGAGASYADARAVVGRSQGVSTKNGRVENVSDLETEGIGVRVLVSGAWGFSCDRRLSAEGARDAALRACAFARAAVGRGEKALAPLAATSGAYRTSVEQDPFKVSLTDKVALCVRAEEALRHPDVKVTEAFVRAQRVHKVLVTSDGAEIEQDHVETGGGIDALAVGDGVFQIRSYPSAHGGSSAQAGWEYVEGLGLEREAPRIAEQAAALLQADVCPSGETTIVVDAEQMLLQVHESVGHPIELDRVYGSEASYAGTSFLKPGDLGSLRYGSEKMNVTADSTTPEGLGTFGFDDEGVAARREPIVVEGVLRNFLTSRETAEQNRRRRGRLDAGRRLEQDAADPDDEPPPRAGRGDVRRPDLRRRRRHLPRDEQELVDRRQAAELPVRHADRLGDQEGQARADAQRRDLHRNHTAVLGVARRGRRARRRGTCRG